MGKLSTGDEAGAGDKVSSRSLQMEVRRLGEGIGAWEVGLVQVHGSTSTVLSK